MILPNPLDINQGQEGDVELQLVSKTHIPSDVSLSRIITKDMRSNFDITQLYLNPDKFPLPGK